MPVIKKLEQTDLWQLRHHRDNTAKEMLKAYTLTQLSFMDGKDTRTIKTSGKYFPIRIDIGASNYRYKTGYQKNPYITLRVRLDEVKYLFNKRTGKKLIIE